MRTFNYIQFFFRLMVFGFPMLGAVIYAQEGDPFADDAENGVKVVLPPEPDHLVPVNPYPGDWSVRYSDQLRKRFGLDSVFYFRMLVCPSFSAEYSVSLAGEDDNPWDVAGAKKLTLKYAIADKSIWYAMPENNGKNEQREVKVTVLTTDLPKALGIRLYDVWDRMLRATRYPLGDHSGLDGVTYEFSMWCRYGEIWSPAQRKSPLLFAELGESLIRLCKATPKTRDGALGQVMVKLEQLETYLNRLAKSDGRNKAKEGGSDQVEKNSKPMSETGGKEKVKGSLKTERGVGAQ
ncbi:MAG: hypothetical protein ACSHX6_07320 [Akkermansiaceae bacterium]